MATRRPSVKSLLERVVDGGKHRVEIQPSGRIVILPLSADPVQADDAALDAEIRGFMGDGDARH